MVICDRSRQAMEEAGLTQEETAKRMKVPRASVQGCLAGLGMRAETLRKFCMATGTSADFILGLDMEEPEKEHGSRTKVDTEQAGQPLLLGNVNIDEDPEKLVSVLRRDAKEIENYKGPDACMFWKIRRHAMVAADWIERHILGSEGRE